MINDLHKINELIRTILEHQMIGVSHLSKWISINIDNILPRILWQNSQNWQKSSHIITSNLLKERKNKEKRPCTHLPAQLPLPASLSPFLILAST